MTQRQIKAGLLLCLGIWLALVVGSCLLIQRLEAQEIGPAQVQVATPQPAEGMTATGWVALITPIGIVVSGIIALVFREVRAMRREAQRHQLKLVEKTEAVAREAAERANIAQAQRERTNKSLVALTKAATGAYSAEDNRRIAEAAGLDVTPEGDPE